MPRHNCFGMMNEGKAAIYHFTDHSDERPYVYRKQLDELKEYAFSLGYGDPDIYCDFSIKKFERKQFEIFLSECTWYRALIIKDFYHIAKNTGTCMKIMQDLLDKGIRVFSKDNGSFDRIRAPFDYPLRVATYDCQSDVSDRARGLLSIRNDVFSHFVRNKTNWSITGYYCDISKCQKNDEQVELMKLIDEREKYDLLIVQNINSIHWRTAVFCRIRESLKLDVFSLQEGFLKYQGGRLYELCGENQAKTRT